MSQSVGNILTQLAQLIEPQIVPQKYVAERTPVHVLNVKAHPVERPTSVVPVHNATGVSASAAALSVIVTVPVQDVRPFLKSAHAHA